ncbi:Kinesin-like protein kif9, partial [Clonorchis sinensis]
LKAQAALIRMDNFVKTFVRIRPTVNDRNGIHTTLSGFEKELCFHIGKNPKYGIINNEISAWKFEFEKVFRNVGQDRFYKETSSDLVISALAGVSGTVICYGQTGAGKTYTISGVAQAYPDRGIIPRALAQIFEEINQMKRHTATVRLSYVEIYNEKMADLLQSAVSNTTAEPLVISDVGDEVSVKGLLCPQANSLDDALALLFEGELNRTVGTHVLNRVSSRAHTIFTVYLTVRPIADGSPACLRTSRINFVDLAGSERVQKTKSDGRLLKEATFINRSLSFLEQMVLALSDTGRSHVPYRQSKLTHFLKNSVGGKCRTVFIANVWNEDRFLEETISTLRFASRVMRIPCHPAVQEHEDIKMLIKRLREENILLKQELLMYDTLNNRDRASYGQLTEKQRQQIHQLVAKYLSGKLKELPITSTNQLKEMFDSFRKINRNLQEKLTEQCQVQSKGHTEQVDKPQQPVREIQRIARSRKPRVGDAEAPIVIETPKLGDVDPTSGFGFTARDLTSSVPVSMAQDSVYLQSRLKERTQSKILTEGSRGSPTEPAQGQKSNVDEPPSRAQAFEEFQKEAGRELINIFTNNRAILAEQLEKGKAVGSRVNEYKTRLELLQAKRLQLRTQREAQGLVYTDQSEQIITEEEFDLLKQVGELETEFRQQFEEWEAVKQAVKYCRQMVDSSRARLVHEFENWYRICFFDAELRKPHTEVKDQEPSDETHHKVSTTGESFPHVQSAKVASFENVPQWEKYERAKEAVIQRHIFGDLPRSKNARYGLSRSVPVNR